MAPVHLPELNTAPAAWDEGQGMGLRGETGGFVFHPLQKTTQGVQWGEGVPKGIELAYGFCTHLCGC